LTPREIASLRAEDIVRNLELLGQELQQRGVTGEIIVAGGAFMLLTIRNRETTKDVDAYFVTEPQAIREAAAAVAAQEGLSPDWLNDGVQGFFQGFFYEEKPPVDLWADYPGLRVYTVSPEYAFAMKAIAGRPEDIPDLEALKEKLHLTSAEEGLQIVAKYVPLRLIRPRTQYLIETLFEQDEQDEAPS
jgi:predicted nucleotidyltransferase